MGGDRRRYVAVVAIEHLAGVGVGRWITNEGATGDRRGIVADDIADDERTDLGGVGRRREPAALDRRAVFAHGVDLIDRRARRQQRVCRRLEVGQRELPGRRGHERAAAAGDDTEDQR